MLLLLMVITSVMSCVHGMEVSPADSELMVAVRSRSAEDVRAALTKKVQINLKHINYSSHTPLSEAVASGDESIVRTLLENKDIDLNVPLERNWTVLHIAAHLKLPIITQLLVSHGASVRMVNEDGRTPLHEAMYAQCAQTALVLLTHIPRAKLTRYLKASRCLLLCLNHIRKPESYFINIPKDMRLMLCRYVHKIDVRELVQEQLEVLSPVLEHEDNAQRVPLSICIETEIKSSFEGLCKHTVLIDKSQLSRAIEAQLCADIDALIK